MYFTLLKPVKFDFTLLNHLSSTEIEQFQILTHYIILQNFYCNYKFKERKFIEVYSQFLQTKILNKESAFRILDWYENEMMYLLRDNSYSNYETKKCKGYRLNFFGQFEIESYQVELNNNNTRKFLSLFNPNPPYIPSDFERENDTKQLSFISQLEYDRDEFLNVYPLMKAKYEDKNEEQIGFGFINHITIQQNECENFSLKKSFSKYDDFSNRYYNFMTNKSSYLRACFKLNDEYLGSSDISNSQPYFFTQLDKINLTDYPFIDRTKIIIEESFKTLVLNGEIYEYLANRLDIEKSEAKTQVFSFFYGDTRYKRLESILELEFPDTYLTLKYLRSIETNNPKFNYTKVREIAGEEIETPKNTYFNYLLQSIERKIFLKCFESMDNFYTVHDSVYYEASRRKEFETAIYNHLRNLNLDLPKLKFTLGYKEEKGQTNDNR